MNTFIRFYRSNNFLIWMALLIPSLLIVAAFWLPFGFSLTALIEEWGLLGLFTTQGPTYFISASNPLALHALRPLMVFPLAVGYFLDPNSFYYWHVLAIFSLLIKGIAASYLIWIATGSRFWGALMGILVLLYPADTMQLAFRPLQINWAISFFLLASSLFIAAYKSKNIFIYYSLAVMAPMLLLMGIGMYEATCLFVTLPFLILYVRDGLKITVRQLSSHRVLILLWMSVVAIYLVYVLVIAPKITSYQSQLTGGKNFISILATTWPKLFSVGMFRSLLGGWFDALLITVKEYSYYGYLYLAIFTAIIGVLLCFAANLDQRASKLILTSNVTIRQSLRMGVAGLILLCLGYGAYLLSPPHLAISQRTFLCATPGAAIVWIAVISIFSWRRRVAYIFALTLVFIGLGAQLFQFHHYVQLSNTQRHILKTILENFNGETNNKTLLILDERNQLDRTWMFINSNLAGALTYFYQKPIQSIQICYSSSNEWRSADQLGRMGTCIEHNNSWTFRSSTPLSSPGYDAQKQTEMNISKTQINLVTIKADGSIPTNPLLKNYKNHLLKDNTPTAIRYRNILTPSSSQTHFNKLWANPHLERYKWSFGNWWSLELPINGSGWREAEWEGNYFYRASAWKTQEKSTLLFDLLPIKKPYFLSGRFDHILSQAIQDSMQIRINQKLLSLHWKSKGRFDAPIPPDILLAGVNTIEFSSKIDPNYYGLSAKLEHYEIMPEK